MRAVVLVMALSLISLAGPARAADARQDFNLVNKTGYDIKEVYVSPSKSADWEEDVLGKGMLGIDETWEIKFHRSVRTCKWDLKVVYADDNSSAVWNDIDLCSVEKITIRYNRNTDTTSATFD
jgi:hypothetical protein